MRFRITPNTDTFYAVKGKSDQKLDILIFRTIHELLALRKQLHRIYRRYASSDFCKKLKNCTPRQISEHNQVCSLGKSIFNKNKLKFHVIMEKSLSQCSGVTEVCVLGAIAPSSRKNLFILEEYENQTKFYVDMNDISRLALFSKTLLQIIIPKN